MKDNIRLASGKTIGHDAPVFIIAAIGNSYSMDRMTALERMHQAADSGVDAVQIEIHDVKPIQLAPAKDTFNSHNSFRTTDGRIQPVTKVLGIADIQFICNAAQSKGLVFLAGLSSVGKPRQTVHPGFEMLRVSSTDLTCVPLLRQVGAIGLPVILSTGMNTLTEIDLAVSEVQKFHNNIILMHSASICPCPPECISLPSIQMLRQRYKLPTGYSGHESGVAPSVAAAAVGACAIERHFTLSSTSNHTKSEAALSPADMALLVRMVREVEKAVWLKEKQVWPSETALSRKFRKSIVFARDLPASHVLAASDLSVKCPGTGISPLHWNDVIGSTLNCRAYHEQMLTWEMITP